MIHKIENEEQYVRFLQYHVMTTRDVAEYLGASKQWVAQLVKEDKLAPFKDQPNSRLFSREEVERYKKGKDVK